MSNILSFWQEYGSILTGGAVIISAIVAYFVLLGNRAIARRRATLDLILHIESDRDLLDARKAFTEIKKSSVRSSTYGTEDARTSAEAVAIKTILNINELVAVSINEGVIDECVFRRWFNSAFIEDCRSMDGYIKESRRWKNAHVFKELEAIATRWEETNADWYASPGWLHRKCRALKKVMRA